MGGRVERTWEIRGHDPSLVSALRARTGLSEIAAVVLVNRGMTDPDEASLFISGTLSDLTPPYEMADLMKGARRIAEAGRRRERILVYADYDADGATAGALVVIFLLRLFPGLDVRIHQNCRLTEGYGMKIPRLALAAEEGVTLVVTVDLGVTDVDPIAFANSKGIDVVVTDHHLPGLVLPDAYAIIDPKRPDCPYPGKELAGVGVAFALALGIRKVMRDEYGAAPDSLPNLREFLDMVALGTVSDMAPMLGENRILVREGIKELRRGVRPGLRALMAAASVEPESVNESDLGFRVGPRLNAAGRMGFSARSSSLLMAESEGEANRLARQLGEDNERRRVEEDRIAREAQALIAAGPTPGSMGGIVLSDPGWHSGVLGIVASRLLDAYDVPVILMKEEDGIAQGSARSLQGFSLVETFSELSDLLTRFGGHAQAAGIGMQVANVAEFRTRFLAIASSRPVVPPILGIDAVVALKSVDLGLLDDLSRLRPFGMDHEEPVLAVLDARVVSIRSMGDRGQHLRFEIDDGSARMPVLAFNRTISINIGDTIDIAFTPRENVFRGRREARCFFRDFREAGMGVR